METSSTNFWTTYFTIDGQNPLKLGVLCGLYPMLFYISNNFYATNSWEHLGYFSLFFLGSAVLVFGLLFLMINAIRPLHKYRRHILFVAIIFFTALLTSYAATLLIKKKILLGVLVASILLSLKLYKSHKKLVVIILLLCVLPFFTLIYKGYEHFKTKAWLQQPDTIEAARFVKTPNVYMIQPDGYVSQPMMESPLYNHKTDMYDWLDSKGFTIYPNFRSNYPASLNSNSSLFAMRQHQFGSALMPDFEMPYAREVISGNNPVVRIFDNNNYKTFFISEDEYFQQNKCPQLYDYFNIDIDDVKFFSKGETVVKDVLVDVKEAFTVETTQPKFFFIEKCLPHHVHFYAPGDRIEEERKEYLADVEEVNLWIKETVSFITEQDPNGIIIVLADHGGWVGMENYNAMFSTKEEVLIRSIFSNLAAIKWNGYLTDNYDEKLKTNVNVFRVLFAALSENKVYLDHLEDDSSYNLHLEKSFFKGVVKVIDNQDQVVYEKQ